MLALVLALANTAQIAGPIYRHSERHQEALQERGLCLWKVTLAELPK
jgi:hypothetical protein